MKASCTLVQRPNGAWLVRHGSSTLGQVEVTAASREEALTKMQAELQYRLELCPCSGESVGTVEIRLTEEVTGTRRETH